MEERGIFRFSLAKFISASFFLTITCIVHFESYLALFFFWRHTSNSKKQIQAHIRSIYYYYFVSHSHNNTLSISSKAKLFSYKTVHVLPFWNQHQQNRWWVLLHYLAFYLLLLSCMYNVIFCTTKHARRSITSQKINENLLEKHNREPITLFDENHTGMSIVVFTRCTVLSNQTVVACIAGIKNNSFSCKLLLSFGSHNFSNFKNTNQTT